jgi:hypothetical protein
MIEIEQIFHHYSKWEEIPAGMWKTVGGKEHKQLLKKARAFTGDAKLYGSFMLQVLDKWPISCEQNLSNKSINRRAWIGHAACCIALGCPESITREAWHDLTQTQQDEANAAADHAILVWEKNYAKAKGKKCPKSELK